MQEIRPGQWFFDEETGEIVVIGTDSVPPDDPNPIIWVPTETVEIRFSAAVQFTPIEVPEPQE